jgi:hypothetical protein
VVSGIWYDSVCPLQSIGKAVVKRSEYRPVIKHHSTHRLILSLFLRSSLLGFKKSMLDCRYNGRLGGVLVVCCNTSLLPWSEYSKLLSSSSSRMALRRATWVASFAWRRASSISFTRVARKECGQSSEPLACDTPRAILSRRLEGGTAPLNGVRRWEGKASSV